MRPVLPPVQLLLPVVLLLLLPVLLLLLAVLRASRLQGNLVSLPLLAVLPLPPVLPLSSDVFFSCAA